MEKENSQLVIDAIVGTKKELPIKLYDLTILRYAWLEKLESPFIQKDGKFTISTVIPTIWILAASKEELRAAADKDITQIKLDALEWADDIIGVDQLPLLIDAVTDKLFRLSKASPKTSGDSEKN